MTNYFILNLLLSLKPAVPKVCAAVSLQRQPYRQPLSRLKYVPFEFTEKMSAFIKKKNSNYFEKEKLLRTYSSYSPYCSNFDI